MNKCNNREDLKSEVYASCVNYNMEINDYEDEDSDFTEEEINDHFKLSINNILDNITKYNISDSADIASTIFDVLTKFTIPARFPNLTIDVLTTRIESSKQGIKISEIGGNSSKTLVDSEEIQLRSDSSIQFLSDAYGLATEVMDYATKQVDVHLFDLLFINRGSIDSSNLGEVNDYDINDNIKRYKEYLFLNIIKYLRIVYGNSDARLKGNNAEIKNLLKREDLSLFKNGKISEDFEKLKPIIKYYLSPSNFNVDTLRRLYNSFTNSEDSQLDKNSNFDQLNAYNSWVFLSNFDNYISYLFPKSIKIEDFGKLTGKDKYKIAVSTSGLLTTFRTSDDINVEKESDEITRLAIKTTPLLKWQGSCQIGNQYLQFSDFEHTFAKIKDLAFNENCSNIVFDKDLIEDYLPNLSEESKKVILGKTLRQVINNIRQNPRLNIHPIFEILSTEDFYDKFKLELYNNFTNDELNKLYSLSLGIFSPASATSLYSLIGTNYNRDYYSNIVESGDSIFSVKYVQYYKDFDGTLKVRSLIDQSVNNIRKKLEETINLANKELLSENFNKWADNLQIKVFTELNKDKKEILKSIQYTVPDSKITVTITPSTMNVVVKDNGFAANFLNFWNDPKIISFIDSVLKLGISNSPELKEYLKETKLDSSSICKLLFSYASRVVANKYINSKYVEPASDKDEIINSIYENESGKPAIDYNYSAEMLNMTHNIDVPTLKDIARAKANLQGVTMSSIVRNGRGDAQGQQTLSRLYGSFPSLYDLLELLPTSATKNFAILNIPGLFEGVIVSKEYYDEDDQFKEVKDMNPAEMLYSNVVYNYIGGLINQEDSMVGNGHILLLSSVNSDKNTIGLLKIDLNKVVNGKAIKDYSNDELKELIAQEFSNMYINTLTKITNDWSIVDKLIREELINKGIDTYVSLSKDYVNGFLNFNAWFEELELNKFYKNPVDLIKSVVLNYNKQHMLAPLTLIDQVHYVNNKGQLKVNQTLFSQIARFNPTRATELGIDISKYPSAESFWKIKEAEVLKSLLKLNFRIDTTNTKLNELLYIRTNYSQWVNSSGNVILAKIKTSNGKIVNITNELDVLKLSNFDSSLSVNDVINSYILDGSIELCPILSKYNYLEYLFTLEFMTTTVGSFISHPPKTKSTDVLELEAGLFGALHKRNVLLTAAMHTFALNLLNGIPENYNIAVLSDIIDEQATINGALNTIKPFDGATFVNPFIVILENYSLGGAKAGVTKKLFVHFKNESTGTGGVIKTAGFGLTNDWIRNSPLLLKLMKKMTDRRWLNKDGTDFVGDILYSYKDKKGGKPGEKEKIAYKPIYYEKNGKLYEVLKIERGIITNTYIKTVQEVDKDGTPLSDAIVLDPVEIDSNYSLWQFFGGTRSLSFKGKEKYLSWSNTSVENVVIAMNSVGTTIGNASIIRTQKDLWLPLKHSDVHYAVTEGAIKHGAANINPAERYYDDVDLDTQIIKMFCSGIQLDKEHHADLAEISMMTQVISACAAKGYTFEAASKIYDALSKATKSNLKEHFEALSKYIEGDPEKLLKLVFDSIIDNLGHSKITSGNFAQLIASDLIKKAKQGEEINFSDAAFPLSDNTVYAKIFSIITSYLTNSGIKYKIPGILSVLTPSCEVFKLYDGRKYESFTNPEVELLKLQENKKPTYSLEDPDSDISDIELDRTYNFDYNNILTDEFGNPIAVTKDGINYYIPATARVFDLEKQKDPKTGFYNDNINNYDVTYDATTGTYGIISESKLLPETMLVRTPKDYLRIKELNALGFINSITENITVGRNLAAYNVRFRTSSGQRFQLWDIDSARMVFELNEILENRKNEPIVITLEKFKTFLSDNSVLSLNKIEALTEENLEEELFKLKVRIDRMKLNDLLNLSPNDEGVIKRYESILKEYDDIVKGVSELNLDTFYKRYACIVNLLLMKPDGSKIKDPNGNLFDINDGNFEQIRNYCESLLSKVAKVRINGEYVEVDKTSIKTQAYELIIPKTFATNFGLTEFADLNEIINDLDYFIKQYIKNQTPDTNSKNYSVAFINGNGLHYYVIHNSLVPNSNLKLLSEISTQTIDGVLYRLDEKGDILYELNPNDKIYVDERGNEVIATYDIDFYAENLHYDDIVFSQEFVDNKYGFLNQNIEIETDKNGESVIKNEIEFNEDGKFINSDNSYTFSISSISSKNPVEELLELFSLSDKQQIVEWRREAFAINRKANSISKTIKLLNNDRITLDNYLEYFAKHPNHRIFKQGRAKHSSFLKALNVIASRTPAQSMQSFMPMKIVAFDNPNINTAHVSTMLILLLGSDYDVDAVSIATFDVNSNGILQIHSPYGNLLTIELLEESMELPFPTGEELTMFICETDADVNYSLEIFDKFKDLFRISNKKNYLNDLDSEIDPNEMIVTLDLSGDEITLIKKLKLLKEFLIYANKGIVKPFDTTYLKFIDSFSLIYPDIKISSYNQVDSLFDKIEEIVNRHNLYLNKLSKYNLSKVLNNYDIHNMYKVISDPSNLTQAHAPIDAITGPLKKVGNTSDQAEEAKHRTPGNFANKSESIYENQVGKEGISVCAVGLKAFFALLQYGNFLLNRGDSESQERLLLGKDHKGITIGDNVYKTIANIRATNPATITNNEVLEILASQNNDHDAALILSALLSLATDNAKELLLSKLNASTKMIGMYIYGVTIGMEFKDIANILMSPVGTIINNLSNGNIFLNDRGYSKINESIFKYFDDGPRKYLYSFDITRDLEGKSMNSPYKTLITRLKKKLGVTDKKFDLAGYICNQGKDSKQSLKEKISVFESLRNTTSHNYATEKYNLLIDFIELYIRQADVIGNNYQSYLDIKTLSEGSNELRTLGSVLSINQGIKSVLDKYFNQINTFERAIYEHTGKIEDIIDIIKFSNDENYRNECINKYEAKKVAINIYDVISKVPHYFEYIRTLALSKAQLNQSYRFRSVNNKLILSLKEKFNLYNESELIRGLQNFIGDELWKEWISQDENKKHRTINIPKGNYAIDTNGNLFELTSDSDIDLSTDWGRYTFKLWFENLVIPDLKLGILDEGEHSIFISDNKFILDLNFALKRGISGNFETVRALSISMLPRIDIERKLFNIYKSEFNKLSLYSYKSMPVKDLFVLYAMIADNWKLGENSLVSILEDFNNDGLIRSFHEFEYNKDIGINEDGSQEILKIDLTDPRLITYIAPFENPYQSKVGIIKHRNRDTKQVELMEYSPKTNLSSNEDNEYGDIPEAEDYEKSGKVGDYEYIPFINRDIFSSGQSDSPYIETSIKIDDKSVKVVYDSRTLKIENVSLSNGEKIELELKEIPIILKDGKGSLDIDVLKANIENKLNPCK